MITYDYLVKIRQEEMLREAERNRMVRVLKSRQASPSKSRARLLFWVGGNLRRWGSQLEIRYAVDTNSSLDQPVDPGLNV
jgi:hypothetical protein